MSGFSERLRELRQEKNLSNKELSVQLDGKISASAISLWELNKRVPNLEAVILLANYFNVSLEYIVGLSDEK